MPKLKIIAVGRNVLSGMNYQDVFRYKVDKEVPLPTVKPVESITE